MITTYKQAQRYLDSFINYEKIPSFSYNRALKPERMKSLIAQLGFEPRNLKVLHIAGTKGKGSTAWLSAWMLASCGFRVGLYTSPHLYDFRERIQILAKNHNAKITNTFIAREDVTGLTDYIQSRLGSRLCSPQLERLSFFEIYTAIALQYFLQQQVDFAVIETGLGGKLDATNVLTPLVSIITHIGYDHMNILGNKLSDIAAEKAGIIKRNTPLICACQRPSVLEVIQRHCLRNKSELFLYGRDYKTSNIRLFNERTLFDYAFRDYHWHNIAISLRGMCQVENAAVALTALCVLKIKKVIGDISNAHQTLAALNIEGRFETANRNPLIVVDVAHNISSFMALRENLKHYYPSKKIIFIFSCSRDKDARKMLKAIDSEHLILTRFSNPRSSDPWQLRRMTNHKSVFVTATVEAAVAQALRLYHSQALILVSGSLFLVSDVKKLLQGFVPSVFSRSLRLSSCQQSDFYYSKVS